LPSLPAERFFKKADEGGITVDEVNEKAAEAIKVAVGAAHSPPLQPNVCTFKCFEGYEAVVRRSD
jgi:hypothetical protein